MSKSDWIWMPHAGHLCIGSYCRFHLNTYVNGYIVSTVGEYWPDQEVRRVFVKSRCAFPKLEMDDNGKLIYKKFLSEQETERLLSTKGDHFDALYLEIFGYEDIGLNKKYESMVFKAVLQEAPFAQCCPYKTENGNNLDFSGYNDPVDAFQGHMELCEKWYRELHSSRYIEKDEQN